MDKLRDTGGALCPPLALSASRIEPLEGGAGLAVVPPVATEDEEGASKVPLPGALEGAGDLPTAPAGVLWAIFKSLLGRGARLSLLCQQWD